MVRAEHLYVHVPFCARRCVYCDFAIAVRPQVPADEYLRALDGEWRARHAESRFDLETLYFGGGTPSKLGGDGVRRMMEVIGERATLRSGAEVTLEANPEDVAPDSARAWRSAGINRVSLGVQSFQDPVLNWMHRTHDAETALRAVQVLRDVGIANVSIDLIFAAPQHVPREWRRDLDVATSLELPHVSVYGLTVEPHTPLGRWVARSDVSEATEDTFEREYLDAHAALTSAGFEHYEVSNYGQPGQHSRHNWAYWQRRPYGGVGPSAHEFDGLERRWNVPAYTAWMSAAAGQRDPVAGSETLTESQATAEHVYLGLRTMRGLDLCTGEREHVARFVDAGWAELTSTGALCLTGTGWLRLDSIAGALTLLRSR